MQRQSRLYKREGKVVSEATIREAVNSFQNAAKYLKGKYFSYLYGWDTREHWMAFMLLLINAENLLAPDSPEMWALPRDYSGQDPITDLWWKPEFKRTEVMQEKLAANLLKYAIVLQAAPLTL